VGTLNTFYIISCSFIVLGCETVGGNAMIMLRRESITGRFIGWILLSFK
jgi:hypothetical protein